MTGADQDSKQRGKQKVVEIRNELRSHKQFKERRGQSGRPMGCLSVEISRVCLRGKRTEIYIEMWD